ncbi:MAG: cytidine deaminase [Chloroflexota bacterium]|nr:MAG: cytidine deaminase [Chloroflexota bacterium]
MGAPPADILALVDAAVAAREQAYAPYSNFPVGAALRTASGRIFVGCNLENAAYPATVCAERVALFSAYAAGEREIVELAVVADSPGPVSPCGICRQVIAELAPRCKIMLANTAGALRITTPQELLPGAFTPEDLPSHDL